MRGGQHFTVCQSRKQTRQVVRDHIEVNRIQSILPFALVCMLGAARLLWVPIRSDCGLVLDFKDVVVALLQSSSADADAAPQ